MRLRRCIRQAEIEPRARVDIYTYLENVTRTLADVKIARLGSRHPVRPATVVSQSVVTNKQYVVGDI